MDIWSIILNVLLFCIINNLNLWTVLLGNISGIRGDLSLIGCLISIGCILSIIGCCVLSIISCYILSDICCIGAICSVYYYWNWILYFLCWTYAHYFIVKIWVKLWKLASWVVHKWSMRKSLHCIKLFQGWNVFLNWLSISQHSNSVLITCKTN
jgi:hypothetical protein